MINQDKLPPPANSQASTPASLDLGPLAWVVDSLRDTLQSVREQLIAFSQEVEAASGSHLTTLDTAALRMAAQSLHEAVGVLDLVERPAAARMVGAMERCTQLFIANPELCVPSAAQTVAQAGTAALDYLSRLLKGHPDFSPGLFPAYRDVAKLAGIDRIHPADLWHGPWQWLEVEERAQPPASSAPPDAAGMLSFLEGVLHMLRSGGEQGVRQLAAHAQRLEQQSAHTKERVFWQLLGGLLQLQSAHTLRFDDQLKRLLSQVAVQYDLLQQPSGQVSERLAQDLLYFIALGHSKKPAATATPLASAIVERYQLDRVAISDYDQLLYGTVDPALRSQLRQNIATFKELWADVSSDNTHKIQPLAALAKDLTRNLNVLWPAASPFSEVLQAIITHIGETGHAPHPGVAMEVATAILFLEASAEEHSGDDSLFEGRIALLAQRLEAVRQSGQMEAPTEWMEALYARLNDQDSLAQVVNEARATIGEVEQALDDFFRHPQKTQQASDSTGKLNKIAGVLLALNYEEVSQAITVMAQQIRQLVDASEQTGSIDAPDEQKVVLKLGNSLGTLSFMLDMMVYQPEQAKAQFHFDEATQELTHRNALVHTPMHAASTDKAAAPGTGTTSTQLGQTHIPALNDLLDAQATGNLSSATAIEQLSQLTLQAELAGQPALAQRARQALDSIQTADTENPEALAQAISSLAPPAAAPALPEDGIVDTPIEEEDLRDIFLEEAAEVIGNALIAIESLYNHPADTAQLTNLRRAFHTLKGSGRMVGLASFGEAAWEMERTLNGWLADAKPATQPLLQLVTNALEALTEWRASIARQEKTRWHHAYFSQPAAAMQEDGRFLPIAIPGEAPVPSVLPKADVISDAPVFAADTAVIAETIVPASDALSNDADDLLFAPETTTAAKAGPTVEPPMEEAAPVFAAEATPADEASESVIESALFADEPPALIDEPPATDDPPVNEANDWLFAPETAEEALAETDATPAAIEKAEPVFAAEDTVPADSGHAAPADEATLLAAITDSPAPVSAHTLEGNEPALFADEPLALIDDTISPAIAADARDAGAATSDAPILELSALSNALSLELPPLEATPASDTATANDEPLPFADEAIDTSAAPAETAAPEVTPAPALSLEQFLSKLPSLDLAPSDAATDQTSTTTFEDSPFAQEDGAAPAEAAAIAAASDEVLFANEPANTAPTAASPDAPLQRLPIVGAAPEASGSALQTAATPTPPPATDHSTDTDSPIHKALLGMLVDTTPQQAVLQDMVDGLPDEEIKHVGDMRIPLALFNAYLNEADVWSRQLVQELSEWVLTSHKPVPHVCEQLAHSLAGSSAAVGMGGLASMARGIEHAIARVAQRSARDDEAHTLHHAAEVVRQELHQFAAGIYHPLNHALLCKLAAIVENVPLDTLAPFCPTTPAPQAQPTGVEKKNVEGIATPTGPVALADRAATAASPAASAATADAVTDASAPPAADTAAGTVANATDAADIANPAAVSAADAKVETKADEEPADAESAAPSAAAAEDAAPDAATASAAADAASASAAHVGQSVETPPAATPAKAKPAAAPAAPLAVVAAPAPTAAPQAAPALSTYDNTPDAIDTELFDIFREEAQTLLPQLNAVMRQWVAHPDNAGARTEAQRLLHTFKGGARLAGAMQLGAMVHDMESAITDLGTLDKNSESVRALEQLQSMLDEVDEHFTRLLNGKTGVEAAPESAPSSAPASTSGNDAAEANAATTASAADSASAKDASPAPASSDHGSSALATLPAANTAADTAAGTGKALAQVVAMPVVTHAPAHAGMQSQVRVRSNVLDRMLGSTGEVMISRARLETEVQQLRQAMQDMDGSLDRLRAQLRDMELQAETQMQSRMAQTAENAANFDPLEFDRFTRVQELTRMMAESVNDVASVQRTMVRTVQASEDNLIAQARQARELQDDLLRSRMVEFDSLSERLYRVVRQAAKETGKQVTLNISGAQTAMDRNIIERIASPFEHLLRNAVVHGIESPEQRKQAGKEAVGHIEISLHQDGNDVAISVRDDGKGLNVPRIREKAVANKLLAPDAKISDDEAMQLIFQSGLSTADNVTSLAGRGVGMDVVRTEVNALGGRIETRSQPQAGTEFALVLPLTTAVTQVVEVQAGDLRFGVPSSLIEVVQRASNKDIQQAYNSRTFTFHGENLPFYWAGAMLQASPRSTDISAKLHIVLVLRSASQRIVMHVDSVIGNHEVVVKNIGPQLARMPGLSGITILPNGSALLIYNPVALSFVYEEQIRAFSADRADPAVLGRSVKLAEPLAPLVLVVDDSITVRRVTGRLLQREGYRVASAANGVAALRAIANERPDLVLSDIEMPQMDGFDLLRNIRGSDELKDLPVIMITSRTADKHRDHAMELGATGFLGKPYPEEAMLELLRQHAHAPAAKA